MCFHKKIKYETIKNVLADYKNRSGRKVVFDNNHLYYRQVESQFCRRISALNLFFELHCENFVSFLMRNSLIVNQKSASQQPFEIICLVNYAQVKKTMFALLSFKEFFGSLDGNRTAERNDIVQLSVDFLFGFDQFDRVLIAQKKAFRQPEITR